MSGILQGLISRFDKGERHDDNHLFSIAKALGVSIEDLFKVIESED